MSARRPIYAKLDGHTVIVCADLAAWMPWAALHFEHGDGASRVVGYYECGPDPNSRIAVSTVFIGINQQLLRDEPGWFESKIFCDHKDDSLDGQRDLYATWDEAEHGHAKMVAEVMQELVRRGKGKDRS